MNKLSQVIMLGQAVFQLATQLVKTGDASRLKPLDQIMSLIQRALAFASDGQDIPADTLDAIGRLAATIQLMIERGETPTADQWDSLDARTEVAMTRLDMAVAAKSAKA